jgi:ABC transporter with metal-binding/Fe-S-binding domain ATP-binding protein
MRIGVLFSGGKDSCLALYKAMKLHKVVCLISLISKNKESYMFHTPNIELTKIQAEAIELPLIQKITEGEKEKELEDLKEVLNLAKERFGIEGVTTGAIKSVYQESRIEKICKELDLQCFNPLWQKDQIEILNELVENNFKVVISGVFAYPLDKSFLGKMIDSEMIKKLKQLMEKYDLNPAGEGGEIETTVLDAPFFKKKIEILDYDISYNENSGVFRIKNARLVDKKNS